MPAGERDCGMCGQVSGDCRVQEEPMEPAKHNERRASITKRGSLNQDGGSNLAELPKSPSPLPTKSLSQISGECYVNRE